MTFLLLALMTACTDDGTVQDSTSDSGTNTISCPEPDPDVIPVGTINEECCARPSEVEIGNGERCHQSFPEEGCVTMVHGPQGGWHIWISMELQTFSYEIDIIDVESGVSLLKDDADSARVAVLPSEDECIHTYPSVFGYLNQLTELPNYEVNVATTPPQLLCHNEVEVSITVTDTDGREYSSSHRALASGDPARDAAICEPLPGCDATGSSDSADTAGSDTTADECD